MLSATLTFPSHMVDTLYDWVAVGTALGVHCWPLVVAAVDIDLADTVPVRIESSPSGWDMAYLQLCDTDRKLVTRTFRRGQQTASWDNSHCPCQE